MLPRGLSPAGRPGNKGRFEAGRPGRSEPGGLAPSLGLSSGQLPGACPLGPGLSLGSCVAIPHAWQMWLGNDDGRVW